MATAQSIITSSLSQILNDDATSTPASADLNLGLTTLTYLLDHLGLDPQTTIGLDELVYTPTAGYETITIAAGISTTLTSVATVATATTSLPHYRAIGDRVVIAGASPTAYNGTYTIVSVPTSTSFTYTFAGGTSPATGTITTAGDIDASMPVRIDSPSFQRLNNMDIPILWAASFDEYTRQPSKANQGFAMKFWYAPSNTGIGTLYMWPSSNGSELHLFVRQTMVKDYATMALGTTLTLGNGVQKVLVDILAAELLDSYNVQGVAYTNLKQKGFNSLRKFKRMNLTINQLQLPRGVGDSLKTMFTS